MPNNIPNWSTCLPANKKDYNTWQSLEDFLVGDFGLNFDTVFVSGLLSLMAGFIPAAALALLFDNVLLKTLGLGCLAGAWTLGSLVYLCIALIQWFDNRRTICMDTAACAVGTIVHDPHSNTNGDLDLDLALAPFSSSVQQDALLDAVNARFGTAPLGPINMYIFLAGLSSKDRLALYKDMVEHHLLLPPPDRLFQQKYFVSTPDIDSYITYGKIKPPLYRCPSDDEDPSERMPLPSPITEAELQKTFVYLPCVIEGHVIVEWLKNIRNGLIAGLAGFGLGCAVCMAIIGQENICALVGLLVAAIFAFLAWLISHLLNDPDDTKASGAAPVTVDPGGSTSVTTAAEKGDTVVVHGSWVTYKLDNQYYEIHPVHAWYLVCRGDTIFEKGTISAQRCQFDMSRMIAADYDRICQMVHAAETDTPPASTPQRVGSGLSVIGGLH